MKKLKTYLIELTIVVIGVLIALVLNNWKENYQAKKYQEASMETVKSEIEENYSDLKRVIEKQGKTLDTIKKYTTHNIKLSDLFKKGGGLQAATLGNAGLEFYAKNQISSIDYKMMSQLIKMRSLSELIKTKLDKLLDYLYMNLFVDSDESKMLVMIYLDNLLETEVQLMNIYKDFIDDTD